MYSFPPHWSYFVSLEDDLIETARYVELCEDNFRTYSTQFTRLLLAAGSEVDVIAKRLCQQVAPGAKAKNINHYRKVILPRFPAIPNIVMGIQWNTIQVQPWKSWGDGPPANPKWWRTYNKVKHERNAHFKMANLDNALCAIAGLYCLVRHLEEDKGMAKPNRFLRIESST